MGLEWSESSETKKELSKWDRPKRDGGMNRDGFQKYPQMLYKAQHNPISGKYEVAIARDVVSPDRTIVILDAEQFNASCQKIVNDDREYENARADGWRDNHAEAVLHWEAIEAEVRQAAAESNYQDRNMSEKAKADRERMEGMSPEHFTGNVVKVDGRTKAGRAAKAAQPSYIEKQ